VLRERHSSGYLPSMSADTVIAEIEALPAREREKVFAYVEKARAGDDSWIPESFRRGMADAEAGRLVDMEKVMADEKPPDNPS
jgi:hypothetical protein